MNPGTVIIILIGVVTFLLYLSKAFKPTIKEKFQVSGESDIKYRAPSNLNEITKDAKDFNKLISALNTPDFQRNNPANKIVQSPQVQQMKQIMPITDSNVGSSLPANTPASILNKTQLPLSNPAKPIEEKSDLSPEAISQPSQILQNNLNLQQPKKIMPMTASNIESSLSANLSSILSETQQQDLPKPMKENTTDDSNVKTRIVYVNTKCPPPPDMSQYIRKDSIPCWGCNLR